MDSFWDKIRHFTPTEFDDPDWSGSHTYMDRKTIMLMEWLRRNTEWPVVTHNKFNLHGCVCMSKGHHSSNSYHNHDHPQGCSAVDFHFVTDTNPREQARVVLQSGFGGIGVYQDCWKWGGDVLPIGFHVDRRKRFQIWKYVPGRVPPYDCLLT